MELLYRQNDLFTKEIERLCANCCYILQSRQAGASGRYSYTGWTNNPTRRIRQHNGLLKDNTKATKYRRPWSLHFSIIRFPTPTIARQFEWDVKHARIASREGVKDAYRSVEKIKVEGKKLTGYRKKVVLATRLLLSEHWLPYGLGVVTTPPVKGLIEKAFHDSFPFPVQSLVFDQ